MSNNYFKLWKTKNKYLHVLWNQVKWRKSYFMAVKQHWSWPKNKKNIKTRTQQCYVEYKSMFLGGRIETRELFCKNNSNIYFHWKTKSYFKIKWLPWTLNIKAKSAVYSCFKVMYKIVLNAKKRNNSADLTSTCYL